jgi:hypothetical protein
MDNDRIDQAIERALLNAERAEARMIDAPTTKMADTLRGMRERALEAACQIDAMRGLGIERLRLMYSCYFPQDA